MKDDKTLNPSVIDDIFEAYKKGVNVPQVQVEAMLFKARKAGKEELERLQASNFVPASDGALIVADRLGITTDIPLEEALGSDQVTEYVPRWCDALGSTLLRWFIACTMKTVLWSTIEQDNPGHVDYEKKYYAALLEIGEACKGGDQETIEEVVGCYKMGGRKAIRAYIKMVKQLSGVDHYANF